MRQTDLQILDELIADDYKPYIEAALKRIRSVYVESRPTVRSKRPVQQRKVSTVLVAVKCKDCIVKGCIRKASFSSCYEGRMAKTVA